MGRLTTAAIIAVALAGATVQSFAGDLPQGAIKAEPPRASVPADQLLAEMTTPPSPSPAADEDDNADAPPQAGSMGQMPPPGMGPGGMDHRGMGPHAGWWEDMARLHHMERSWGLFYNQPDKKLTSSDVETIAQAVLLTHGNHSWKVANVAQAADGSITFAYTTADGSVIARFSVDPHSGRMTRIG